MSVKIHLLSQYLEKTKIDKLSDIDIEIGMEKVKEYLEKNASSYNSELLYAMVLDYYRSKSLTIPVKQGENYVKININKIDKKIKRVLIMAVSDINVQ